MHQTIFSKYNTTRKAHKALNGSSQSGNVRVSGVPDTLYKIADRFDRLNGRYKNLRFQVKQLQVAIDRKNNRIRNLEAALEAAKNGNDINNIQPGSAR